MAAPAIAHYDACWGYRTIDARRYEQRRYGGLGRRLNLWLLERALGRALAGVRRGSLVLDVPCGTGVLERALAGLGLRVIGADISPAMLAVARERPHALAHVCADLEAAPCRQGSFDAVVCTRFLMHVPGAGRPRLLSRLAELTRGPLIVTISHPYTLKTLTRVLRRTFGWPAKRSPRLDRGTLAAEVVAAGLRLERIIRVMPLFSEVWVVVMCKPAATT